MGLGPPWVPEGQNPSVGRGWEGNLVHPAPALREEWPPGQTAEAQVPMGGVPSVGVHLPASSQPLLLAPSAPDPTSLLLAPRLPWSSGYLLVPPPPGRIPPSLLATVIVNSDLWKTLAVYQSRKLLLLLY